MNNYRNLTALICFVGCDPEKTEPPTPDNGPIPMTVNCHDDGECTALMQVDAAVLQNCFQPICDSYNVCSWPPGTPNLISDQCSTNWVSGTCDINSEPYQADHLKADPSRGGCVCIGRDLSDLGDPVEEDDCCIDRDALYLDIFAEVIGALGNCGISEESWTIIDSCEPDEMPTWQFCDPTDLFPVSSNAEIILYIDDDLSYISMTTPVGSDTSAVSGGGSARTGPDKFLTAWISAEDATLGSQNFTEWLWWMDGHMDIDVSAGTISVPVDDEIPFKGKGKQNSARMKASIYMGEDASGTIDPLTHTWTLDFLQDSYGWEVEIHLEGLYEDVP